MSFPISLEQQEYEALVEYARQGTLNDSGAPNADAARSLETFLRYLEKKNNIQRYALWVQWQEASAPLPPGTIFPNKWPPELREYVSLTSRPIAKSDVMTVLNAKAKAPMTILVTSDPAGLVGWTELDKFFK